MYTNDELLKRRAALSSAQLARLRQRIQQGSVQQFRAPTIPRRESDQFIPLSFTQQRLWFLQQLEPESTAYNEMVALHLHGVLDYELLKEALHSMVQRHEILRTIFPRQNETIVQLITPASQFVLEVPLIDLSTLPAPERLPTSERLVVELQLRPFQLTEECAWRTFLARLDTHEYIFAASLHHIIADAWSLEIFTRELLAFYRKARGEESANVAVLPLQYADYAIWQQQNLKKSAAFEAEMQYWQEHLRRPLPVLELLTDYPRPAMTGYRGERQYWTMPDVLYRALNRLCVSEQVTLFTLLLSTFAALLSHLSRQEVIIVGTPVAGRDQPELEALLGCFINTLALRLDLSGRPTFRELLRRVHTETMAALEHQSLPFEKLIELVQPERHTNQHAIFQTMFTFQNVPQTVSDLKELHVQPLEVGIKTSRLDLSIILRESTGGISGYIEYATDLFSASSMNLFLQRYQHLLEIIVADPEQDVGGVSLLLPHEEIRLLSQQTAALPVRHVLTAFSRQVERVPGAVAVSDGSEQLSYRMLENRSYHLATLLQRQGIQTETLVGVYTERGVLWATAILAIFRAGGVYLPLNPEHPGERIQATLARSGCQYVLTTRDLFADLCALLKGSECQILCLEELLSSPPTHTWREPVQMDSQLAYIIYTSGSTGEPKGAMIQHDGMLNHLYAKVTALDLYGHDIVAQTASQSFDISLWQLLAPWLVGGQAHIYTHEIVADPPRLLAQLEEDAVTVLEVVPSWLSTLLEVQRETGRPQKLSNLRWLIPTGEALTRDLCLRWLQSYPHIPLLNAYGPTECSDDVTHYIIHTTTAEQNPGASMPIGRTLPNLSIYVLDSAMHLLPPGLRGEICIGGIGVGRGYLGDPVRTAQIFVPDPWSTVPGARLYRTGDLGSYTPEGLLLFHGRADQQVKLRGYRIEMGEIEQVFRDQPGVNECVALVHEPATGGQQLLGYIVGETGMVLDHKRLLRRAREVLPEYMVPTQLIALEKLPLTSHGKIDRKALAAVVSAESDVVYTPPGNALEAQIAAIWADLLGLERAGVHTNFFTLGGNSLSAVSLMERIEEHLGTRIPLATFFATPTIAGLALAVRHQQQSNATQDEIEPPLEPAPRGETIPLSFTQMRQWLLEQLHSGKQLYNMVGAIHLRGNLHVAALTSGLHDVLQRHEILRTALVPGPTGEPWQVIAPTCTLIPREIDLGESPAEEQKRLVSELVTEEQQRPFDMTRAPMLRMSIIHFSLNEHILLLSSHQMLFDGWSIEIFLHELGTLYAAYLDHQPSPLPPLPLQYADYAIWQKRQLEGKRLHTLRTYWQNQLANATTLNLPTRQARPATPVFQAASLPVTLSHDLSHDLLTLSKREGVTLFMVLLAAFQAILARYSQQVDIIVGSPVAGRNHVQLEPLIGNFLNTLVLRTDLSGQPDFSTLLQRVRQTVLGAYAHQDLPFEQLLTEMHSEHDLTRNPLFQVLFAFENYPRQEVPLPGLSAQFLEISEDTTTFDLTLTLWEEHGSLVGTCKYNAALFEAPFIQHLRDDFIALLNLVVVEPEQVIADLPAQSRESLPFPGTMLPDEPLADRYIAPRDSLEEQLTAIWSDLLNLPQVGVTSDFFVLGGHSLTAVRLMARIEQQVGKRLPLATVFQHRTVEALAEIIRRHLTASPWTLLLETHEPTINLLVEARREMKDFSPVTDTPAFSEPQNVLLTGATGFIGTFLLGELLTRTTASIFCLVRASSVSEGERRIRQHLQEAQLWQSAFQARITIVPGDLAQPRLGLSESSFSELAEQIEVIYHNGAFVNMLYPYEELKAANVRGTREILDLATTGKVKPVHYISTLGIFPHTGETRIQYVREDASIDDYHAYVPGGYAQSKWVAEKMVSLAAERGLPVAIYRPGRVTGHSWSGEWRANDMLYQMLGGCIQLGMSPVLTDEEVMEMVPVDYVSQAIVALSLRPTSPGKAFHLTQPIPTRVNDLLTWIKTYGYPLETVQYHAWVAALEHARATGQPNILAPLIELLPLPGPGTPPDTQLPQVMFENTQTVEALAGTDIHCAPVDEQVLHRYLAAMVSSGTLPPPPQSASLS